MMMMMMVVMVVVVMSCGLVTSSAVCLSSLRTRRYCIHDDVAIAGGNSSILTALVSRYCGQSVLVIERSAVIGRRWRARTASLVSPWATVICTPLNTINL